MRVGVVEIMETGHITFAETLCRIFCSDPDNQVYLFIIEKHSVNLGFLCDIYSNLDIVVKDPRKEMEEFLNETREYILDRIYLVTITKYFRAISRWLINARFFLTIHNIDEWFGISFSESLKRFFYSISGTSSIILWIYFFKVNFIFPSLKRKILKKVNNTDGRLVVLSSSLQKRLQNLQIVIPSEVIPFSVFDPALVNEESSLPKQLRICVPGILSQYRRDYLALLDLIETRLAEFKPLFVFDFLGGIKTDDIFDNPSVLMTRIDSLKKAGFPIIVHNVQFIPPVEYNTELSKSDVIVGNMNVTLNRYSSYGITKETGIPFAMIRAGKPGILPDSYPFPEELRSSTLLYHDFKDLGEILVKLITDRVVIADLKKKAFENSKKFSAESIYTNMVEKHHL